MCEAMRGLWHEIFHGPISLIRFRRRVVQHEGSKVSRRVGCFLEYLEQTVTSAHLAYRGLSFWASFA